MAEIVLERLTKVYDDGTRAVSSLGLDIADGEFLVFVGPSGCGKTTALRMIAGLEEASDGSILIGGERVDDLPTKDRDIAMVFQNYALYPHMTAFANMAFGLKLRSTPRAEIERRVQEAARLLGLEDILDKRPRALSGGQRQRVAMGRAIVREPRAFLMDEPLSNLDANLRVQMRSEVSRIQRELGVTTVYVTHDQVEAMTMGDRVAVMRGGVLQQVATPQRLYEQPANLFVAEFIGSPAMNIIEARLERSNGDLCALVGDQRLLIDPKLRAARPQLDAYEGRELVLGIRPEDIRAAADAPPQRRLTATIDFREDLGGEILLHFSLPGHFVASRELEDAAGSEAVQVIAERARREGVPFVARVDRQTQADSGTTIELTIDTNRLHFFDRDTGTAISDAS